MEFEAAAPTAPAVMANHYNQNHDPNHVLNTPALPGSSNLALMQQRPQPQILTSQAMMAQQAQRQQQQQQQGRPGATIPIYAPNGQVGAQVMFMDTPAGDRLKQMAGAQQSYYAGGPQQGQGHLQQLLLQGQSSPPLPMQMPPPTMNSGPVPGKQRWHHHQRVKHHHSRSDRRQGVQEAQFGFGAQQMQQRPFSWAPNTTHAAAAAPPQHQAPSSSSSALAHPLRPQRPQQQQHQPHRAGGRQQQAAAATAPPTGMAEELDPSQCLNLYLITLAHVVTDIVRLAGQWHHRRRSQPLVADAALAQRMAALQARLAHLIALVEENTRDAIAPGSGWLVSNTAGGDLYAERLGSLVGFARSFATFEWLDEGAVQAQARQITEAARGL